MIKYFYIVVILIMLGGCAEYTNTPSNPGGPINPDPGIMQTDINGNVQGGDTNDWKCLIPNYPYPNPTDNKIKVRFNVTTGSLVQMYFILGLDSVYIVDGFYSPGTYERDIYGDSLNLSNVYKRLYVRIGNQFCYGDIKFE